MNSEQIIALVNALFTALTPYLGATLVAEIKSLATSLLPTLLTQWVGTNITPTGIIDALFAAIEKSVAGRPFVVFALQTVNKIVDQVLPTLLATLLVVKADGNAVPKCTESVSISFHPCEVVGS